MARLHAASVVTVAMLVFALGLSGCPDVAQDPPSDFSYETEPVAIFNPDWGVIPLANNLLNPAFHADIPLDIPGVAPADPAPETVDLPPVTEEDAQAIRDLGYPAEADSELTLALKAGMNTLDGFVPGFVVKLPFSKPLDMDSLVPASGTVTDGVLTDGNAEEANFFFLDITDPENPVIIDPGNYYRIFNLEMAENYPYYLTLRLTPAVLLPRSYTPGHTYLIVATGLDPERGLLDTDGNPFWPDRFLLLFNSSDPFITPEGTVRNNLLPDLESIQELEGARQITNYGVSIWEKLVGEGRTRNEIVSAFHFTITSNPKPIFLNPVDAVNPNGKPLLPKPADQTYYDTDWKPQVKKADACLTTPIEFTFDMAVDEDTVTEDAVKLWKVSSHAEVPVTITTTVVEEYDSSYDDTMSRTRVTLTPKAPLTAKAEYMVAVNDRIRGGERGRRAVDEVYFGLTRVATPLVEGAQWLSPFLDSRVDTLILNNDTARITEETLSKAEEGMMRVLTLLEAIRTRFAPHLDRLVEKGFVEKREAITLFYTFTTSDAACGASGK